MGLFSSLLSTAAPVAGFALGGPSGAAMGGLLGGLLGGGPYQFNAPNVTQRYNELSPQIQSIISMLQQGGLDTRPYDALRKNAEADAFNTAQTMNKVLNQNMAARGLSNSTIRTTGNRDIYSQALADMATRMAQIDAAQSQAANADRLQRSGMALSALQNLLRAGLGADMNQAQLGLNTQRLNYGAESDYGNTLGALAGLAGNYGLLDYLRKLLNGSQDTWSLASEGNTPHAYGGTP